MAGWASFFIFVAKKFVYKHGAMWYNTTRILYTRQNAGFRQQTGPNPPEAVVFFGLPAPKEVFWMRNKKRSFVLALAASVAATLLYASADTVIQKDGFVYLPEHSVYFVDVDKSVGWAMQQIDYLAKENVVSGTDNCVYSPHAALTRADFVVMLYRAYHMGDYVGGKNFSDVPDGKYYSDAVSAAKNLNIVSGDEKGRFHPSANLTRQDAMAMLRRTLNRTGMQFATGSLGAFSDASSVSGYASADVAALVRAGVISGSNGKIQPWSAVTRAEMAVMLYRAQKLERGSDGSPTYVNRENLVNLCVGGTVYTDVSVSNYRAGSSYTGLYECEQLARTEDGYSVTLGDQRALNQSIVWRDGVLKVNGTAVSVAEDCVAVCIEPYGVLDHFASTGGEYKAGAVSLIDGVARAVYYVKR